MFSKNSAKTNVSVLEKCLPKVGIAKNALRKMFIYVDECKDEIGWLGTVIKRDDFYLISDVLLFEQEVHSTTTEITPEGLSRFAEEILSEEGGVELWNSIKVWGHSHVNMGVSPSGQDNSQMETFSDNGHDFFIRIIANKKGDLKLDLYDYASGVIYNDIDWIEIPDDMEKDLAMEIHELKRKIEEIEDYLKVLNELNLKEMSEEIELEMKEKVSKKKSTVTITNFGQTDKSNQDWYGDYNKSFGEFALKDVKGIWVEKGMLFELTMCTTLEEARLIAEDSAYTEEDIPDKDLQTLLDEANSMSAYEVTQLVNEIGGDFNDRYY